MKEKSNYNNIGRDPFLYCKKDHISSVLTRIQAHHCQEKGALAKRETTARAATRGIFSINSNYTEFGGAGQGKGYRTSEPLSRIMTSTELSLECSCV